MEDIYEPNAELNVEPNRLAHPKTNDEVEVDIEPKLKEEIDGPALSTTSSKISNSFQLST
jgi:hypothetical protein